MKKFITSLLILFLSIFLLTGCTKNLSYTFNVETGDRIKITLDTTDKYSMNTKSPINFTKEDKDISTGIFLTEEGYEEYKTLINKDSTVKIIENSSKENITYLFYTTGKEYNYLIKINDSKTGFLLANKNSEDEAKEVFNRISFTYEK